MRGFRRVGPERDEHSRGLTWGSNGGQLHDQWVLSRAPKGRSHEGAGYARLVVADVVRPARFQFRQAGRQQRNNPPFRPFCKAVYTGSIPVAALTDNAAALAGSPIDLRGSCSRNVSPRVPASSRIREDEPCPMTDSREEEGPSELVESTDDADA